MVSLNFLKWMTVLGGFISYFLADGCTYSAGILFFEFKEVFQASSTATSLLPALIYSLPQFMSLFLCPLTDVIGFSTAAAWGAVFLCLSFIITSYAWQIGIAYFTYGVLMSLGLQLTYTSAFMTVVSTFKDSRWFGLACGVMVCGGGIGAFATNHLLAWILSLWTWREALVIQGGIFLHAWISSALFYWSDELSAMKKDIEKYESYLEFQETEGSNRLVSAEAQQCNPESPSVNTSVAISSCRRLVDRLKKLWYLCPIFMILTPSHLRPRAHKLDYWEVASKEALSIRVDSFCLRLGQSLARLFSPEIWTNAPFLIYVFTNGVAAAGVVIPWTFAYDYVRSKWLLGIEADSAVGLLAETQIAWYPSLIGLGSCAGQVLFGFVISKTHHPSGCTARSRRNFSRSNLTLIFTIVLLLNGVMTLGFTYAPTPSYVDYGGEGFIFLTTAGRVFAVICFFLGVTDGAFMTIMGPMLENLLEEINFPAGLGISLCITGAFNLAGTLAGGSILDLSGSYYSANLLAACLSLSGFSVLLICCLLFRKEPEMVIGDEDTSERL